MDDSASISRGCASRKKLQLLSNFVGVRAKPVPTPTFMSSDDRLLFTFVRINLLERVQINEVLNLVLVVVLLL